MKKAAFVFCALILVLLPLRAPADGFENGQYYTVYLDHGEILFEFAGGIGVGDEYISADNQLYTIETVNEAAMTATAIHRGAQEMPDVNWLETAAAVVVSAGGGTPKNNDNRLIAMYATHSDESYKPSDGTESAANGHGGIYDVAQALKKALEDKGIEVVLDETIHAPHDAGAYRRSRQTAIELLKKYPDALIDLHRDGIPNANEYKVTIDGKDASKVRLEVGRSNQNASANKQFALELKAVADQKYPELIKDVFIGKGSYNQDLMSNAILLEFGTHTLDKDRAIASTELMADVLVDTIYGGVSGAASDGNQATGSKGAGTGIIWLLIAVVVGIGAYALLQTGNGREAWDKVKRGASELTLGMIGKKPDKGDRDH
ncbi:MAG: stage II sporulation protein P [Firmicutes bacterium]|nr:stage II sporulation protein P [Bacillota bacterium]